MPTTAPVLNFYDVTKHVTIQGDASSTGIGAVLQDGRPIEYASRAVTPAERDNYALIEETAAIVFALEGFHTYVYGKHVTDESDHEPLMSIVKKSLKLAPVRLQRMLLRLQRYNFTVVYLFRTR